MGLFRLLGEFYDVFDCRVSVNSLFEVYKDQITTYFTRLRNFALKKDSQLPSCVSVITPKFCMALNQLSDHTRKLVSPYNSPDQEGGHTRSH